MGLLKTMINWRMGNSADLRHTCVRDVKVQENLRLWWEIWHGHVEPTEDVPKLFKRPARARRHIDKVS